MNTITPSCYCHLQRRSIRRIRRYLDDATCAVVIRALVLLSRLDYAKYFPDRTVSLCDKEIGPAAVLAQGIKLRPYILSELYWLPAAQRIIYKVMYLAYKALNEASAPEYLRALLCERQNGRIPPCSAVTTLVVPRYPQQLWWQSFHSLYAPTMWHSLPPQLSNRSSFSPFKKAVKTFLFRKSFSLQIKC